ncbi:MAG TPA: hypothetical protein VEB68_08445 [Croceibacterium sp.]|nr:hypothetical protein [Propylenella sp.]HYD24814.1 hypothetical protein [Croceibacterium sp.]
MTGWDWPTTAVWGALAFGAAAALAAQTHRHVRRAFHQWRLARRLARDPYILRDEMNEYQHAIGEDLGPLQVPQIAKRSLVAGLVYAFGAWLIENDLDRWWDRVEGALLAGALLYGLWRWLNDPPEARAHDEEWEGAEFLRRDNGLSFAAAVTIVMLLLLAAIMLF